MAGLTAVAGGATAAPASAITISPERSDFGNTVLNRQSEARKFIVSNEAVTAATVETVQLLGEHASDWRVTAEGCSGTVLSSGARCEVHIAFAPSVRGVRNATLDITTEGGDAEQAILTGRGVRVAASADPEHLDFGTRAVGVSTDRSVTVVNVGDSRMDVMAVSLSGDHLSDFVVSDDGCTGKVLQPLPSEDNACSVTVRFTPTDFGPRAAVLTIASPDIDEPLRVSLTGTGDGPARLDRSAIDFGLHGVGTTSAEVLVTLRNEGLTPLEVWSVMISGLLASDFALAADSCSGVWLQPSHACTVSVRFSPSARGPRGADLEIRHDAARSPGRVALRGDGHENAPAGQQQGTPGGGQTSAGTVSVIATLPLVRPALAVRRSRSGVVVRSLALNVPSGSRVEVRCRPASRCGRHVAAGPRVNFRRLRGLRLRSGTLLELRITSPGLVGRYVAYRVRRGRVSPTHGCLPPGATKPVRCA